MDMNLERGAGAAVSPNIPAAPVAMREAALPGYIVRKLFAANVQGERQTIIEACRAELDWSIAGWKKIAGDYHNHDARYDGPHPAEAHRMPHERAAARVLNVWGHLHPQEYRARALGAMIRARRAHGWDVSEQRKDLRWYVKERAKLKAAFSKAVEAYRAERERVS